VGQGSQRLFAVIDVLEQISEESGQPVPRLALAWLLTRPTVSSVIMGVRNAEQLRGNLAATDVVLTSEQIERLDTASAVAPAYPYWHQRRTFLDRNPPPV